MSDGGYTHHCHKCGKEIDPHLSAYKPWDEVFKLVWKAGSDDVEHVEDKGGAGKQPSVQVRQFCSYDCLESFVQMDYEFPNEGQADIAVDQ